MSPSTTARATLAALAAAGMASSAAGQVRLALQPVGGPSSLRFTLALVQPPGETRRLYILRQSGQVLIVRDDVRLSNPFMDISAIVVNQSESGLLGMTFHPDFQANGFFYVCYTGGRNGAPSGTYIARYHTSPANPESVTPGSATPVFYAPRSAGIHNGGWIGFGPNGYLYLSTGDAGNSSNAQNPASLHGKMLRIDVNGDDFPDPAKNYAIPPTNPFFGSATAAAEMWSVGLRNPWRCSFDRLTGDLWIGDVGLGSAGEIDFQLALTPPSPARNYGWPCMEGNTCLGLPGCNCADPALIPPAFDMGRPPGTSATLGGYVYRGSAIPELQGAYLFADFSGSSWSFRYDGAAISEFTVRSAELGNGNWTSLGEDSAGELYLCDFWGTVYRVVRGCYGNCDGSTQAPVLNISDFICFLNQFAAGDHRANCDGSTHPPVLGVADFLCFQSAFEAGCP